MPTIHTLRNLRIVIYPNDHEPALVHLIAPDWTIKVVLGSNEQVAVLGRARGHQDALAWIAANEADLRTIWQAMRATS